MSASSAYARRPLSRRRLTSVASLEMTPSPAVTHSRRRSRARQSRRIIPLVVVATASALIGVVYVSQSAHVTQSTYVLSNLESTQAQLSQSNSVIQGELTQAEAPERIDAAAQHLGLQPSTTWTEINPATSTYVPPNDPPAPPTSTASGLAAVGGELFGHFGSLPASSGGTS